MKKGIFITIEGPDGSGKSTQIRLVKQYLEAQGIPALITREPGGTEISEKIRALVLDKNHPEMNDRTEAHLYAAARAQHVAEVIKPALSRGETVICDRFVDSSIAYQGYGRQLGDAVRVINVFAADGCVPDVTFLLKISPAVGKERKESRLRDRLELQEIEFHQRVFDGYMALEKQYPERVIGIDAQKDIGQIHEDIRRRLTEALHKSEE